MTSIRPFIEIDIFRIYLHVIRHKVLSCCLDTFEKPPFSFFKVVHTHSFDAIQKTQNLIIEEMKIHFYEEKTHKLSVFCTK